jgi:hypothetical protein
MSPHPRTKAAIFGLSLSLNYAKVVRVEEKHVSQGLRSWPIRAILVRIAGMGSGKTSESQDLVKFRFVLHRPRDCVHPRRTLRDRVQSSLKTLYLELEARQTSFNGCLGHARGL